MSWTEQELLVAHYGKCRKCGKPMRLLREISYLELYACSDYDCNWRFAYNKKRMREVNRVW